MSDASRNAPCPCGSGKKYKRCCGAPRPPSPEGAKAAEAHLLDGDLVKQILKYGLRRFPGADSPEDAFVADTGGDAEDLPFLAPWAAYHWRLHGRSLGEWFLEERAAKLTARERTWLEAQTRAWISIWEVTAVVPGVSLDATDLLSGESRHVTERSASRGLARGAALLGRIVDFEGVSVIAGMRAYPLPPDRVPGLLLRVCERLGAPLGRAPIDRLREPDSVLAMVSLWEEEVEGLMAEAGPPRLTNTDGDELRLTTDLYEMETGSRDWVLARLSAQEGVERDEETDQTVLVFTRAGNEMIKAGGPTVIGRARFAEGTLAIETNSTRRADDMRARVEEACPGLLRHLRRTQKDTESLWEKARSPGRHREKPHSPETVALFRDLKAKHYEAWIDQSIPALGGATPRHAATNPLGREMLIQLMKEMEHMEASLPDAERYDFSVLRKRLGLE